MELKGINLDDEEILKVVDVLPLGAIPIRIEKSNTNPFGKFKHRRVNLFYSYKGEEFFTNVSYNQSGNEAYKFDAEKRRKLITLIGNVKLT